MSVELTPNQERLESVKELRDDFEHALPAGKKVNVRVETKKQAELGQAAHREIDAIAKSVESQQDAIEELQTSEEAPQNQQRQVINQELRAITQRRELQAIRRKLPKNERLFSSMIHTPVVRMVSEAAAKSVSRPSGLLGGGIVAFLGTTSYLYLAKHLGFQYNYGIFLALFVAGFALGLVLELSVHVATASRRASE